MSGTTSAGRHTYTDEVSLLTGTQNNFGAWVEVLTATEATTITHVSLMPDAAGGCRGWIQVGVDEAVIATLAFYNTQNVGQGENLALPVGYYVGTGATLTLRIAAATGGFLAAEAALGYYTGLTEEDDGVSASSTLKVSPVGSEWVAVTTGAPAWTSSGWVELLSGLDVDGAVVGVGVFETFTTHDYEVDLAIGAAGSEVLIGTLRGLGGSSCSDAGHKVLLLPAPYHLSTAGRIAARVRGPASEGGKLALLYYGQLPRSAVEETFDPGQSFGPLVWAEILGPDDTARAYAPVTLPDPNSYYLGYKAPELLGVGRVARALSDEHGQYESQRFSTTLDDTGRQWRTWLGDADTRLLLNRRVVVRMISEPAWRAKLRPRTVAIGLIRDYRLE